jgi:hypothetical protein
MVSHLGKNRASFECQYFDTFIDLTVNYLTVKAGTVFAEMRNHAKSVETVKSCEVVLHG